MKKITEMLKELLSCPRASGQEERGLEDVRKIAGPYFDRIEADNVGNIILFKSCKKENAKKLLIDAHFDVIGMMVTAIHDGGFLSVINVGGIDTRILPSSEVTIHGKSDIYGLVVSTPPHLKASSSTTPKIDTILIDTGIKKEELEKIVSIGDSITLNGPFQEINGGYILSSYLDDRACACSSIYGIGNTDSDKLEYDVYVTISSGEEIGRFGARCAVFNIEPDIIITTDVNFAKEPDVEKRHSIECKKGPSVDLSALTDRKLSKSILRLARENNIPCQLVVEPNGTGTNNDTLSITGKGARCAVMSLPLKSMHTTCESVNISDVKSLADLLSIIACTKEDLL